MGCWVYICRINVKSSYMARTDWDWSIKINIWNIRYSLFSASLFYYYYYSYSYPYSFSLSLSLVHTHTHTHTMSLYFSLYHYITHLLSHSFIHFFSLYYSLSHSLGTPNEMIWPGVSTLPFYMEFKHQPKFPLRHIFTAASDDAIDLLEMMWALNPSDRSLFSLSPFFLLFFFFFLSFSLSLSD